MERFLAEVFGTGALIVLGDGVVAGVLLARSKAQNAGWIVITFGWGLAVMTGIYIAGPVSGAHLNPAVTLGLAVIGKTPWDQVPTYIAGEFVGAFLGAVIVYLAYLPHWEITDDPGLKLAVFSTGPAVRNPVANLITEIIGTFMLLFGILAIISGSGIGSGVGALIIGLLIVGIGLSLGGPTGYAINPARDLGPRIAHFLLPIPGKGGSDWEYSWIPVVGPIIGGILGALAYQALFTNFALKIAA
ncbi:MAG: aquaporin family protein [Chloroflexota bacterium]|jgi:glycerol uptake facilitator protein|nr:aquaporin family protein [Chloroflexota bacterium]